jgi:hypothetical protein
VYRQQGFGSLPSRLVGREEDDVGGIADVEQLSSEAEQRGIRLLDSVLVPAGLVRDGSPSVVHHRRDERIGVVEFVGDDDPTLLETVGIGDLS